MFVQDKSDILKQGDILGKIHFIPASFQILRDDQVTLPQIPKLYFSHIVILSNCCDLQWHKNRKGYLVPKRNQVLVAPLLFKMPFAKGTEEYNKLIENGENKPDNDPIQYFCFGDNDVIGRESVVDFSTIIPIKSKLLQDIGTGKLLELDVKHRHLLRMRLFTYFSRVPDEEWDEVKGLFPEE